MNSPMPTTRSRQAIRRLLGVACLVALSACTVRPQLVTPQEVTGRVQQDLQRMFESQEPITAPVTLEQAVARALKYDLDVRLKRLESALALGLTETASRELLPNLLANAGYRNRNRPSGGYSRGILDGQDTTRPTTSEETERRTSSIEFSWNALDFGVAYYRAKQTANQYLIAEERRRKVAQNIVLDVKTAYWRALGAQRLQAQAEEVLQRSRLAISRSREAEKQRLISPALALNYQRALLDAVSLLQQRRQDLDVAKRELAALMNLPSGMEFAIAEATEPALPGLPRDVRALEELALAHRPELREEDLRRRITADDVRRQLASTLPGISFDLGIYNDSNRLNYFNQWAAGGLRMGWDLMRLAAIPAIRDAGRLQAATDDMRRMALSMAVLTQVRVGTERYRMAVEDYQLADETAQVEKRLSDYTRAAVTAKLENELEAIRVQARHVLANYQRAAAYAAARIAYGRLHSALGYDLLHDASLDGSLDELSQRIGQRLQAAEAEAQQRTSDLFGHLALTVSVRIEGHADPVHRVRLAALATEALRYYGIGVDAQSPHELVIELDRAPAVSGIQRSTWLLHVPPHGSTARQTLRHQVLLPAPARTSTEEASLQAALAAHQQTLRRWAQAETRAAD